MKKQICICLTVILIILNFYPVYGEQLYKDIKNSHWAYSYIKEMSSKKIISGYTDGKFYPDKNVTYGEFIKMMYVAQTGNVLEQPKEVHWAKNYYTDSLKIGLFSGSDIEFENMDKVIPRKVMALIVSNSISIYNKNLSNDNQILKNIKDVDSSSEHASAIAISYSNKILNGYPDNSFRPESGLSRAEAAAAIYRAMKYNEKYSIEKDINYIGKQKVKNRDFEVDEYETKIGYMGISKFKYSEKSDCIGVYSDRIQDINLFIDGNKTMKVVNTDNEYWKEDGYYVYVFKADNMYNTGSKLGLSFGLYMDEVYYYSDASI